MDLHKYIHAMENDDDDEKNMEKIFPPHWYMCVYVQHNTTQSLYERYTLATIPFAIKKNLRVSQRHLYRRQFIVCTTYAHTFLSIE